MSTEGRIKVLSDQLVNKIAAGEIIERPASVVKELLDNAIDAGAGRIAVTIEQGGKRLIRVADDGRGMVPVDLKMSVLPHATSKITCDDDLFSITTMGFRGEALASISAVAKMRIVSRCRGVDEAHEILVTGEVLEESRAAGGPVGTTIEVRDLFFNVPARRRFLRADSTEVGHINEQIARAALAHPNIAFELTNNNRMTQNLPSCDSRLERIAKSYGVELASELMHISREERGLGIEAYAAPPAQSRGNANWQYIFVNNRHIRDRYIQHAVKEAYRGLIEPHRHGVIFLFLTTDPASVDVNVHPTKTEVRWSDPNVIHSQVLSALRETFQRCDLAPALKTSTLKADRPVGQEMSPQQQNQMRTELADALKATTPLTSSSPPAFGRDAAHPSGQGESGGSIGAGVPGRTGPMPSREVWESLYGSPPNAPGATADGPVEPASYGLSPQALPGSPPTGVRAIQLHNLYLVTETEDGIAIIDQHALHERVMYEQLKKRITEGPLESQRLLLPETLSVTPEQAALLESEADLLHRLGIEVTPFGSDSVAVNSFPVLLKDTDVVEFMRDLLDELRERPTSMSAEEVVHSVLDMMACKAAVKAGDSLTDSEINALIAQKHLVEKSSNCPHGRPTMLRLSRADLEKQFKRS